jgi:quercetin dioxygenase-like cupin family protein
MTDERDQDHAIDAELFSALALSLPTVSPSSGRREALLAAAAATRRFERFVARVGALCDLGQKAAERLLDGIDDAARWIAGPADGVSLFHIDAGPRLSEAICGFVRLSPNSRFPEHAHAGDEVVLVMSGGFVTSDGVTVRAGEELAMPTGSAHHLTALPGPDLLYLVVVDKGIVFAGESSIAGPDDPRM